MIGEMLDDERARGCGDLIRPKSDLASRANNKTSSGCGC